MEAKGRSSASRCTVTGAERGGGRVTILYVEDDVETLKLVSSLISLKFPAVKLSTASDGESALRMFDEHRPRILITDVAMPEIDGITLAHRIRLQAPETMIIAISALSREVATTGSAQLFDYILQKPVKVAELYSIVDACIATL